MNEEIITILDRIEKTLNTMKNDFMTKDSFLVYLNMINKDLCALGDKIRSAESELKIVNAKNNEQDNNVANIKTKMGLLWVGIGVLLSTALSILVKIIFK